MLKHHPCPDRNSIVTIILPVFNEDAHIRRTLMSILSQSYPHGCLEILIADGMSSDNTRSIIETISKDASIPIFLYDNPQRIMPAGFNVALQHARGEFIVLTGGHCELPPNYVQECVRTLMATKADCVGGSLITRGQTVVARSIALAQSSVFGVGGVAFRMGTAKAGYVDTVAFGAYRSSVFEKIGLLDEELVRNQDDEFNFRLTQAGGRIWLEPSIQSIYYSRASFRRLWKQYFDYGFYKVRVIQKRGAVPAWRHLVPGVFVATLVIGFVLFLISRHSIWLAPALAYVLVNWIASVDIARQEWRLLPYLPASFAVLHFAYGFGFLSGLWHWRRYGFRAASSKENRSSTTSF